MRFRYSVRFLLSATAVLGVLALGLGLWMDQVTLEDVAAELNRANAKPYVWDHWNADTFLEDQVEVAHLSGAIPCVGLHIDTNESTLPGRNIEFSYDLRRRTWIRFHWTAGLPSADNPK